MITARRENQALIRDNPLCLVPWTVTFVLVGLSLVPAAGTAETDGFSRSWPTMGTYASVTVGTQHGDTEAGRAVEALREAFDRVNRTMSVYSSESDLTRLNRWSGALSVSVDPWLADVLRKSKRAHRGTGGAFSISLLGAGIQPGLKPNHTGKSYPRSPTCTEQRLQVSRLVNRAYNPCPHTGYDLGGIAKGYALDRGVEVLEEHGIEHYIVELGRSLRAGEPPNGLPGWPVVLAGNGRTIWLKNQALSVSQQDQPTNPDHVMDPLTGESLRVKHWVAVEARRGWVSDMASTALLVDPHLNDRLVESFPSIQRIWIVDQPTPLAQPATH